MRGPQLRPIVIAAGGTGGHFFPAEALAAALIARGERVVLITDARSSASRSAVFGGGEIHVIAGAGVAGRSIRRAAAGLVAIGAGVLAARRILEPLSAAAIIGFGGYPSVAPLVAARTLRHRPVLILHDQNAVLGKANRLLARLADRVALSFPATGCIPTGSSTALTGNPVRPAIKAHQKAVYALPDQKINLLVLGGSLGASVFATLIPAALARLPQALRNRIDLVMQCPAPLLEKAQAALDGCGVSARLSPFFADVAGMLVESNLVIARSGGSTVAELAVVGRPAVLIPLTINADQRANADALAAAGGAIRVEQSEGEAKLAQIIEALLNDPARLAAMAEAAGRTGIVDAAERLAELTSTAIAASPRFEGAKL
jgi:UDP-N-acetylglucosamine--N-acetylmuramyl-(pentapeptide) pyrophosphoryl-undecaprenol N-acetylglucosamine transferase